MANRVESAKLYKFSWTVTNYVKLDPRKRVDGEWNSVEPYNCRLVLFPKGRPTHAEDIAIFLEMAPSSSPDDRSWENYCTFSISLVNHNDASLTITKEATHVFCPSQKDRGWDSFTNAELKKVLDAKNGYLKPPKCTDIVIQYTVNVTGVRKNLYLGLQNQGATCYLNSFIQSLFHIPQLRREIYNIPTKDDQAEKIPLALQRLFYRLQTETRAVDTEELTKSFGWSDAETRLQHDVQELSRKLLEALEKTGYFGKTLIGTTYNYIKCMKVDYESTRKESYSDISLTVKGFKTLKESFQQYCEVEILDGDNMYETPQWGHQKAKKGILFETFPPILYLHLKRFEYDFDRDRYVKVNDRLKFPPILNLEDFLSPTAEKTVKPIFHLHGVLVHSGSVSQGHYYAFLRPTKDPQWYRFDDSNVSRVTEQQAIDNNFGGIDDKSGYSRIKNSANAYMLIYLREQEREALMEPVKTTEIPKSIYDRYEAERIMLENDRRKKYEIKIYVATERHFRIHYGPDLVLIHNLLQYVVHKDDLIEKIKVLISKDLNISPELQLLWHFSRRKNKSFRPETIVSDTGKVNAPTSTTAPPTVYFVEPLDNSTESSNNGQVKKTKDLLFFKYYDPYQGSSIYVGKLYVSVNSIIAESLPQICLLAGLPCDAEVVLFEEVSKERIDPINVYGTFKDAELRTGDIIVIQDKATLRKATIANKNPPKPIKFIENSENTYELNVNGNRFSMKVQGKGRVTLGKSSKTTDEDIKTTPVVPFPSAMDYYRHLMNFEMINLYPSGVKNALPICIELQRKISFEEIQRAVAKIIKTTSSHQNISLSTKFGRVTPDNKTTLVSILNKGNVYLSDIFYEVLDFPVDQLPNMACLKVTYRDHKTEPLSSFAKVPIYLPKLEATVQNVAHSFLAKYKKEVEKGKAKELVFKSKDPKFKLLAVREYMIYRVYSYSTNISSDADDLKEAILYIEEVLDDELPFLPALETLYNKRERRLYGKEKEVSIGNYEDEDQMVQCAHQTPDGSLFGEPFFFVFKKGEKIKESLDKLKQKLTGYNDVTSWKVNKIKKLTWDKVKTELKESECVTETDFFNLDKYLFIGLEHRKKEYSGIIFK